MSYSLQLTIVTLRDGVRSRISSMSLTDPVSSERRAVLDGLKNGNSEIAAALDSVEHDLDGTEIPLRVFGHMDRNAALRTINGVEVNGSTFRMIEEAAAEIEAKIVQGWTPVLFLHLV